MTLLEASAKTGQNVDRVFVEVLKELRFRQLENRMVTNYENTLGKDAKKKRQSKMTSKGKDKDKHKNQVDQEELEFFDNALSIVPDGVKRADLLKLVPSTVRVVEPVRKSELVTIRGPLIDESEQPFEDYVSARGISTYPMQISLGVRLGDPICDQYLLTLYENRTYFCLADGCNWGPEPREAARKAIRTFMDYVKRYQREFVNLNQVGHHMLRAYQIAQETIVEGRTKEDLWQTGTTTMLAGAVFEVEARDSPTQWAFLALSLGDCKAFHYDSQTKKVVDITDGNRGNVTDARDPGGRLGPYIGEGEPDLRNLELFWCPIKKDDILLILTDGVYDNFGKESVCFCLCVLCKSVTFTLSVLPLRPSTSWQSSE
jgi:hypothetical protein